MDVIVIVAGNSYATMRAVINCFDATLDFPGLEVGAKLTPVLASLMEAGFSVVDFTGNGNVTTYFMVREQAVTSCNPLTAVEGRLNTQVTIQTGAGTESGTLILVGPDVVEILEPSGDILLIPASSIESVI
ncbi:hypothetical protein HZF08_09165 [Paenibacillus sp. CGMCC 1.16610]|uniref:Uncharacterized protein n=1 Tax=Paenibacillus anseongense TaxID=2682845 RepID=A0ABW9ULJ5_9BACL|nr:MULTISPECIES: hypothetical protein [Paenibacillus]MBA2938480.1 hypothetical protein [Paenibacillus sp. CGMCC 1.16610]MVQ39598.1 hypothetical protein [Paenibacillus anseongense]